MLLNINLCALSSNFELYKVLRYEMSVYIICASRDFQCSRGPSQNRAEVFINAYVTSSLLKCPAKNACIQPEVLACIFQIAHFKLSPTLHLEIDMRPGLRSRDYTNIQVWTQRGRVQLSSAGPQSLLSRMSLRHQ